MEPGTAEPFISHPPIDITIIRGFLLLMSDGLYDAYATTTNSMHTVNHDIACLVQRHMDHMHDINEIAQKVIAETVSNFRAMVQRGQKVARMDDITLVIRNLGYPLGQLSGIVTAPATLKNPFNFSQSQPQTSQMSSNAHYENSRFHQQQSVPSTAVRSQMYVSTASNAGYTSPYYTHPPVNPPPLSTTSEMKINSSYGRQDMMSHQPHPSGPNTQLSPPYVPSSASDIHFPTSSTVSRVPSHNALRKSGSDSRVNSSPRESYHNGRYALFYYTHA